VKEAVEPSGEETAPKTVVFLHRRKGEFWSVEGVFASVADNLGGEISTSHVDAPLEGAGLRALWGNLRWAKSVRGDLFHVTGDVHYLALALTGAPVVLTIHDLRFLETARGWKRLLLWLLWLYLPARAATKLTAISETTKEALVRRASIAPGKVRVIPNPVSSRFEPQPRAWNADRPVLLHVGTTENKNLERVASACAGLRVRLHVLGRLRDEQRRWLGESGVDWQSFADLSWEEVAELYRDCDLVLFPSLHEGFGLPIVEGQAVGRPVLTSDRSPMRETAGGGALLVDPEDVDSIREGLDRLLREEGLRRELVERGFENVARFQAETIARQYAELYGELWGEGRSRKERRPREPGRRFSLLAL